MSIELKDYAKDIKINLSSVLRADPASSLKENQIFSIALASGYATKSEKAVSHISSLAQGQVSEAEVNATKIAASLMAMNNIYYRFGHLVSDKEYLQMPARLRMAAMSNPGVEKVDFELYSLAISAITGCGLCIDSHVKQLVSEGLSKQTIQHTIKIAAVVNALAQSAFID